MKHSNITVSSGKLQFAELIKAHFYTPFGVPCEHPLPLPLGEMAERSECPKGRSTREYILPLPLGEVAERSEDGEGKPGRDALSVTCGDSSPGGRAKGGVPRYEKWSVSASIRSIRYFPEAAFAIPRPL